MEAPTAQRRPAVERQQPPETVTEIDVRAHSLSLLWLTPDKPDDISVGRSRIASRLAEAGMVVDVRGTTPSTVLNVARSAEEYDVIVGTTRAGAIAGTLLSAATDTPLVVDHVDPISQLEETNSAWLATMVRLLEDVAFRQSEHTLFVYEEEAPRVERHAEVAVPTDLGVDFERISNPDPEQISAASTRLAEADGDLHGNLAIYVGGLEPIYHVEEMLESIEHLDGWSLLVLGSGSLEETVEQAAAESEDVVFPGSVPHGEIPGFLALADVGVCLVDDPRTLKVLEYGAAALPTVHLRGKTEERYGDLLEYCAADPENIAMAIRRASQRDGQGLHEYARQFSWDAIGTQYERAIVDAADTEYTEKQPPEREPPRKEPIR